MAALRRNKHLAKEIENNIACDTLYFQQVFYCAWYGVGGILYEVSLEVEKDCAAVLRERNVLFRRSHTRLEITFRSPFSFEKFCFALNSGPINTGMLLVKCCMTMAMLFCFDFWFDS